MAISPVPAVLGLSEPSAPTISTTEAASVPPRDEPKSELDTLAREIQLQRHNLDRHTALQSLVQRICALPRATGAAIALETGGCMVCVATSGNAPSLGVALNPASGLSGECVRTGALVHCHDTETDPRVNPLACLRLNLRSAVVVPVRRQEQLLGLLEVLSDVPHAFHGTDVLLLQRLADSVAALAASGVTTTPLSPARSIAARAATTAVASDRKRLPVVGTAQQAAPPASAIAIEPAAPPVMPRPREVPFTVSRAKQRTRKARPPMPPAPARLLTRTTSFLKSIARVALVVWFTTALLFGTWVAYRRTSRLMTPPASSAASSGPRSQHQRRPADNAEAARSLGLSSGETLDLGAELGLFMQNIRTLAQATGAAVSSLLPSAVSQPKPDSPVPPLVTEGKLLQRIEPVYPVAARRSGLRGPVVLRARVGKDGRVQQVSVLRGHSALAAAATAAVKRWRYEPFRLNGTPVEAEVVVTVTFTPPQS